MSFAPSPLRSLLVVPCTLLCPLPSPPQIYASPPFSSPNLQPPCRFKPPQGMKQALIQGGCIVFKGRQALLVHLDASTAAHVDFGRVVELVKTATGNDGAAAAPAGGA